MNVTIHGSPGNDPPSPENFIIHRPIWKVGPLKWFTRDRNDKDSYSPEKKAPQNPEPISHDKSVCASIIQENQKTVAEFVPEYRNVDINYEKKKHKSKFA